MLYLYLFLVRLFYIFLTFIYHFHFFVKIYVCHQSIIRKISTVFGVHSVFAKSTHITLSFTIQHDTVSPPHSLSAIYLIINLLLFILTFSLTSQLTLREYTRMMRSIEDFLNVTFIHTIHNVIRITSARLQYNFST